MLTELVMKTRSFRRFQADAPVSRETLVELVDLARHVASARNLQPLRYIVSCDPEKNDLIFPCVTLTWPGIEEWSHRVEQERPAGYIIVLGDTQIHTSIGIDCGIAAQTIMLGAAERGLGSCIIGIVHHAPLRSALKIPEQYRILVVIALGKPSHTVVLEESGEDPIAFWPDENGVWHVCKRKLEDILLDC